MESSVYQQTPNPAGDLLLLCRRFSIRYPVGGECSVFKFRTRWVGNSGVWVAILFIELSHSGVRSRECVLLEKSYRVD